MSKECNILILSAGRRKRLYDFFVQQLQDLGIAGKVFVTDANPELSSVCMSSAHSFPSVKASSDNYFEFLEDVIAKHNINIIIPTNDLELSKLACFKELRTSNTIFPVISNKNIVDAFTLKTSTFNFFNKKKIQTPRIVDSPTEKDLPLFAKLNNSSSSIGAQKVETVEHLEFLLGQDKPFVFQEFIAGEEYTIDFFIGKNGLALTAVPRRRIEVRGGEVSKSLAIKDELIIKEVETIASKLDGAYGPMCIQVIKNKDGLFFIEINTRFGGGYPLTHQAGANFIEYIINDYFNIPNKPNFSWRDKTLMLRYDHEVIVHDYSL